MKWQGPKNGPWPDSDLIVAQHLQVDEVYQYLGSLALNFITFQFHLFFISRVTSLLKDSLIFSGSPALGMIYFYIYVVMQLIFLH